MPTEWNDVAEIMAPRCGSDPAVGLNPALLVVLLEVVQRLIVCYMKRPTANPGRLVRMARRRSRAMKIWLAWQAESVCANAATYNAISGDRVADAIMEVLATVNSEHATEKFEKLAALPIRGD